MASSKRVRPAGPLVSIDEAAVLLGASRSSVYRSIERGDLPLPVFRINGRLRIARRAVERLIAGEPPGDRGTQEQGGDNRHRLAPGAPSRS